MRITVDEWYLTLMELFDKMFHNDSDFVYTKKGLQCYKLFLYIYIFGSVIGDHLPYIFIDESIVHEKSPGELKNIFMNRVSYWAKERYLKKLKKEGFILTNKGLEKLFAFVCDYDPRGMTNVDLEKFKKEYSPRISALRHAGHVGLTTLQLSQMDQSLLLCGPMLGYGGYLLTDIYMKARECLIIPDALVISCTDEKIFVEADNCTERKSTSLIPKLEKYSILIPEDSKECLDITLHFSVWHTHYKNDFKSELYEYNRVCEFYDFFYEEMRYNTSFQEFTEKLTQYTGEFEPAIRVSDYLKKLEAADSYKSPNELKSVYDLVNLYESFDKYFVTRQRYIFRAVKELYRLDRRILTGVRLVCLPIYVSKNLLNCVYIENVSQELIAVFLKKQGYSFDRCEWLVNEKEFVDTGGDRFVFRHTYCLTQDMSTCKRYVAIENISDDYGGALRVRTYIHRHRTVYDELDIICLYNSKTKEDPLKIRSCSGSDKRHCRISFATYEEFLGLNVAGSDA